jgi:hypothetical protein
VRKGIDALVERKLDELADRVVGIETLADAVEFITHEGLVDALDARMDV